MKKVVHPPQSFIMELDSKSTVWKALSKRLQQTPKTVSSLFEQMREYISFLYQNQNRLFLRKREQGDEGLNSGIPCISCRRVNIEIAKSRDATCDECSLQNGPSAATLTKVPWLLKKNMGAILQDNNFDLALYFKYRS